jgi:hypothetical protein
MLGTQSPDMGVPGLVVGEPPILIQWTWAPACLSYLVWFQLAPTRCNFEISEAHIQFWDWDVDKSLKYGAGQWPDHGSGTS